MYHYALPTWAFRYAGKLELPPGHITGYVSACAQMLSAENWCCAGDGYALADTLAS